MGYVGTSVGIETVKKGLFENTPINIQLVGSTGGAEITIYKWNQDFTDVEYMIVSQYQTAAGGAAAVFKVDIGGVNKINENADGYHYQRIDCTAITGLQEVEIKADVTNATSVISQISITTVGA